MNNKILGFIPCFQNNIGNQADGDTVSFVCTHSQTGTSSKYFLILMHWNYHSKSYNENIVDALTNIVWYLIYLADWSSSESTSNDIVEKFTASFEQIDVCTVKGKLCSQCWNS